MSNISKSNSNSKNSNSKNINMEKHNNYRRRGRRSEPSLSPQHATSRRLSISSSSINPNHLPVAPDLPGFLQSSGSTTRSDDDDSSSVLGISTSAYYIPGITEKSRLLQDDDWGSPRRHRLSKRSFARDLYTPSCSRSLDNDSLSSSQQSYDGHSSLPLVLEFNPDEIDCEDEELGESVTPAPQDRIEVNVGISAKQQEGASSEKIQSEHHHRHHHRHHHHHRDHHHRDHSPNRNKVEGLLMEKMTLQRASVAKALLQSQLGSIQDVWEEHDSRQGVQTFRAHQMKKQEKTHRRTLRQQKSRSASPPSHRNKVVMPPHPRSKVRNSRVTKP